MGTANLCASVMQRIMPHRPRMAERLALFSGRGLEIGGSSAIFGSRGLFPIYQTCASLDNVTFSNRTAWEGVIEAGRNFRFNSAREPGYQYVMEGAALESLTKRDYDFVASSHMLEHTANPLAVLRGWKQVLKDDGILALVLPHRDGTFDHRRPVTRLEHIIQDFEDQMDERDATHLGEIVRLHDLRLDPLQSSRQHFEKWILDNYSNRGAHHHVFDMRLAAQMIDFAGFQIIEIEAARPFHILLLARKTPEGTRPDNSAFLDFGARCYRSSPFPTDRAARTRDAG